MSELVAALQATTELTVVIAAESDAPLTAPPGIRVTRVTRSRSKSATVLELMRGVPAGRTITAAFYRRRNARRVIDEMVELHAPDVVFTHGLGGAALCAGLAPVSRTILDADTVDPDTYRRLAADTPGWRSWQWALDVRLVARWHRRHLPGYGGVTVVSANDVELYAALSPEANVVLVPNGVRTPSKVRPDPGGSQLLFLGDLTYAPNNVGVGWFIDQVLPQLPGCVLRVVGEGAYFAHTRVQHAGFVADLADEWATATLMVVPIRAGGGTRLKVLEAFAHGVPVVSTAVGVEGIGALPGVHYACAETPTEFIAEIDALLTDVAGRQRMAMHARQVAEAFEWAACTAPLLELVHRVAPR
ncbi:MAG: sugar transferase, PEP-CTERM/EpsH1 system associated [Frankiales bacterium]|nr:sugar transferase, PEP-CTERM/EpsH1 system associated [Frankiales bacterium]